MINLDKVKNIENPFESWHYEIERNTPTCYIYYNKENFVVPVKHPLGKYPLDYVWYYPCMFNNKPLILVEASMEKMGFNNYGSWGIHYL